MKAGLIILCTIVLSSCAGLRINQNFRVSSNDWVTMGGASSRMHQSTSIIAPPLVEVWQYNTVGGLSASPLVRDSVIIIGTLNGELQAVNFNTGKRLGYVTLEAPVVGTPVWDGTNVIVPMSSTNTSLVSVSLDGPGRPWAVSLGPIESSPLIQDNTLYVTTLDGLAYCINKSDGSEVWKFKTETDGKRKPIRSSPSSDGEMIFFGCDDAFLYAVGRKDGKLLWKYQTKQSIFATPIVVEGRVMVGSIDGIMYCLDSKDGRLLWSFEARSRIYGTASTNGTMVFFGTADGTCHALDIVTGAPAWSVRTKSVINSAPLVVGEIVYLGSLDRTLYAFQLRTGKELWRFEAPGRIKVTPVSWGNMLLVVSEDRFLTALGPSRDL